jgi:hypothetical protein
MTTLKLFSDKDYIMSYEVRKFDIKTFQGSIPSGFELIEYEEGTDPVENGMVLYGFDEVGMFCENPRHAFISFGD